MTTDPEPPASRALLAAFLLVLAAACVHFAAGTWRSMTEAAAFIFRALG